MHLYFFLASSIAFSGLLFELQNLRKIEAPSKEQSLPLYFFALALTISLASSYIGLFHEDPSFKKLSVHPTTWSTISLALSMIAYFIPLYIKGSKHLQIFSVVYPALTLITFAIMTFYATKQINITLTKEIKAEVEKAKSNQTSSQTPKLPTTFSK